MKEYVVDYWEQETIWIRKSGIVKVENDVKLDKNNVWEYIQDISLITSDVCWETSEHHAYDKDDKTLNIEEVE